MWILFGSAGSGSAAVEMALERCGVPCRVVRASTWEDDSARAELLAANPLGQIPTLQTDDGVITESAAILIHLGLTFSATGLLPADAAARAPGCIFTANCLPTSSAASPIWVAPSPAHGTCWRRWCRAGPARGRTWPTAAQRCTPRPSACRPTRHWRRYLPATGQSDDE